jgi:xylulokinase
MTKPAVLVIDVGTTVIKTGLYDFTCRSVDRISSPNDTSGVDLATAAERLWATVRESVLPLAKNNPDYRVSAVGLTGFMHSVIALDQEGKVLPFVVGEGPRQFFDEMIHHFGVESIYQKTGSRLDVSSVPPQVLAWREHKPTQFEKVASLLPVKDYLRYRLTGQTATDEIDACGTMLYNLHRRRWDPELLHYCGLELRALPPVLHCTERAGVVTRSAASELGLPEGTPVAVGGGDDIEILGSGVHTPQQVCEHIGSTGSFLRPLATAQTDPARRLELYPAVVRGDWVLGGSCSNVSRALDWFLASSNYECSGAVSWQRVRAELAQAFAEINSDRPFFLPYLHGERAPLWNPDLRAGWFGLRNTHTASDLLLAVVEGICFSLRNVLEVYADLGLETSLICSSGGFNRLGAQRLRATIYGKPIRIVNGSDPTSFATCALTLCSIGELRDPRHAMEWLEHEPDVEPEQAWRDSLDDRFSAFVELTRNVISGHRGPGSRGETEADRGERTGC